MPKTPLLRVARPTDNLEALRRFYQDGLGLDLLFEFKDHNGFDGMMFGHPGAPYHFEFTRSHTHPAGRAPTKENLLIFYLPDKSEWIAAAEKMKAAGFQPVASFNPYWDKSGFTFEDTDGYRIVLQNADWE